MKILAIMASHRKNKNTDFALKYLLSGFSKENEIEVIKLADKKVKLCTACDYCLDNRGKCVFDDDMGEIIKSMLNSDLIIIATPLYFNSVSSMLKIMIDRTQLLYNALYKIKDPIFKEKKAVVLLSVGGARLYYNQFEGIGVETEHFIKNINGKVLDFIKYNNTDRVSLIDNDTVKEELKMRALKIEKTYNEGSWKNS